MTPYIKELVYITLIFYVLSTIIYFLASNKQKLSRLALLLGGLGLITNTLALIARASLVGRLPLTNGAEFILCFSWFTVLMYLIYELKSKFARAGGIVMLIASILTGSILVLMAHQLGDTSPLMPALKSPWLTSHVTTAAIAYSGFALAAGLAAIHLNNPASRSGEESIYKIVIASFAMLTLTIVLGAIWAEQAWGRYWSWDPKETWALITWIIYAIYLHLYRSKNWKGQKSNMLVVGGFILVLFTYFGVNYLLTGLHSYS